MATLKEALTYASQNPDSDFAKQLTQHVKSGQADAEAKSMGIDLTPIKQYNPVVTQPQALQPEKKPGILSRVVGGVKKIGGALISSEKAFGKDIAAGIGGNLFAGDVQAQNQKLADSDLAYIKAVTQNRNKAKSLGQDTTRYDNILKNFTASTGQSLSELFPEINKTTGQVLGDAGGVALDIATAGTYKGVGTTGKLLTTAEKTAQLEKTANIVNFAKNIETGTKFGTKAITEVGKNTLGATLKNIGSKTATNVVKGGSIGYGYDVANNLQQGKTGTEAFKPGVGTGVGAFVPVVGGLYRASQAVARETAPRIINSLVKPSKTDFSYGKNPGKTVSELGITGNNLQDFGDNVYKKKQEIGQELGAIYVNPKNSRLSFNVSDDIAKIDNEIAKQAKGGKTNQNIVTTLQDIKDSLLYDHTVNADGQIVKLADKPRNLSGLSAKQLFDLKQEISARTRFTGNPSDDNTVNSILKNIYGDMKEKLNVAIERNNPEIRKLNEQFAGLSSAELAIVNRDKILQRQNLVSMPIKVGGSAAIITAIGTGGAAIPVLLAGVGAGALDKALSTTYVKTRMARWLSSQKPSMVSKILEKNPAIKTVLFRTYPKLASQLSQE